MLCPSFPFSASAMANLRAFPARRFRCYSTAVCWAPLAVAPLALLRLEPRSPEPPGINTSMLTTLVKSTRVKIGSNCINPPIMGIGFALGALHECAANFSALTIIRVGVTNTHPLHQSSSRTEPIVGYYTIIHTIVPDCPRTDLPFTCPGNLRVFVERVT